jgi:hypothetical protein
MSEYEIGKQDGRIVEKCRLDETSRFKRFLFYDRMCDENRRSLGKSKKRRHSEKRARTVRMADSPSIRYRPINAISVETSKYCTMFRTGMAAFGIGLSLS